MTTLLKPLLVREELLRRSVSVFTVQEFSRIFQTSSYKTKYFLEKQTNQGLFVRLKKGLYTLKTDFPGEEEIANTLYKPSYISFEYALAYYGVLPEMPYKVTSATTKPTRIFTIEEMSFAYYTIKKQAYTGYTLVQTETKSFLIAEREKALVDYLYFESIGKKPHNDRLIIRSLVKEKLFKYTELYGRESLYHTVKDTYDTIR